MNGESYSHPLVTSAKVTSGCEYLLELRDLSETYGEKLGIKHLTGLAGMLHDLGKYTNEFREYILETVNNTDSPTFID
ncbi:hypothetical protein ACIQD3_08800 [Peribacillus loiseleuriae]|uniref:hypothetical protein n=1 Tax=Peribacillus loiseleuriae TaxID=1679170 RepID=UPI00382E01E8